MKKGWICGILACAMLVSLLSGVPMLAYATESESPEPTDSTEPTTNTEPTTDPTDPGAPTDPTDPTDPTEPEPEPDPDAPMTSSPELIDMLKTMEGFAPVAFWDYAQWTIGYGTRCPDGMEHYYTEDNPITVEEAEKLLRAELDYFEGEINKYDLKYDLNLEQHEFDALVSFSYNCGANWTNEENGRLNKVIRSGDKSNELIYSMCLWSRAGSDYILIPRRKSEANLYINGVYKAYNVSGSIPDNFKHVFLDGNGGKVRYVVCGYNADEAADVVWEFSETPSGYTFAGWYTQAVGGTKVTVLDGALANGTVLYAQWKDASGKIVSLPVGDPVDNIVVKVTDKVNIRTGAGSWYPIKNKVDVGTVLTITATTQIHGTLWGKCEQGWVSLNYTNYDEVVNGSVTDKPKGHPGTVTGSVVNVRIGPGMSYAVKYTLLRGDRVEIFDQKTGDGLTWGKLADGNWICMDYVLLDEIKVVLESVAIQTMPTKVQYVQMQDKLDLTGAVLKLTYSDGTTKTVSVTANMVTGFSNEKLGNVTLTVTYEGKTTTFQVSIIKATVVFKDYNGTVLSSKQYAYGEAVTVPAEPKRPISDGYYYDFSGWDKQVIACAGDAVYTAQYKAVAGRKGTVTANVLNVREGPGKSYEAIDGLARGAVVTVYRQQSAEGIVWGQIGENRWVSMEYIELEPIPVTLTSISLSTMPTKTQYVQMQDKLDLTGAVLTLTYSDGSTKTVSVAANTVTGFSNATLGEVTLTITYEGKTTTFQVTIIKATVVFQNYDGTVLSSGQYAYGETVVPPSAPTRPSDDSHTYRFIGWDKEVVACAGDAVYTAQYEAVEKPATPTGDLDGDGKITDWDGILLNRYLAGWTVSIKNPEVMDCDGDGRITDWDGVLLDRYLAGWTVNSNIGK